MQGETTKMENEQRREHSIWPFAIQKGMQLCQKRVSVKQLDSQQSNQAQRSAIVVDQIHIF